MSKNAEDICLAGGFKQVLLVGGGHYRIGKILKNKGFDVKLFAVFAGRPNQKSDLDPSLSEAKLNDILGPTYLRNDYESGSLPVGMEDLLLIDLYKKPELKLNYTDIILDSIDREDKALHTENITVLVNEP